MNRGQESGKYAEYEENLRESIKGVENLPMDTGNSPSGERFGREVENSLSFRDDSPPSNHENTTRKVENSLEVMGDSPSSSDHLDKEIKISLCGKSDGCPQGQTSDNEVKNSSNGVDDPSVTCTGWEAEKSPHGMGDFGTLPPEKHMVGRQVSRCDGIYVKGKVQGTSLTFTADTGATRTILSTKAFKKIPASKRPKLQNSCSLASADGKPLHEIGKGQFKIDLGNLQLQKELVVADIEDEALLGLDILMKGDKGPADIKLTEGKIILNNITIPCIKVGESDQIRKVTSADQYTIPPRCEALINVYVDRSIEDGTHGESNEYLIEPYSHFMEEYPLMMASCLVETDKNVTNVVRVMNPFDFEVKINQNTVIGVAEKIKEPPIPLLDTEDKNELENFNSVRRIKMTTTEPVKLQTNEGIIRNITKKGTADGSQSGAVPEHLEKLYNDAVTNRTSEQCQQIATLLNKYSDAFSKTETDIGCTHLIEHAIDTGDAAPIKQPPRRIPLAYADEEKKAVTQLLDQGIIRKSMSPWGSPIQLVRKKNGKMRPVVDFRRLNLVTVPDAYGLPRIQDCLDAVSGATLFSTFDVTSSYHQIPVKESDIPKTAMVTKYGLFEYLRLPFGVTNGPGTCQRLMELILQGLQWQICLIYLDDVICYSRSFEEHLTRLDLVLSRIKDSGLKLKPEKCELLKTEVTFLGHLISDKGVLPNPDNTSRILSWPAPKTVTEVRQILGLSSYYRRFIKNHSAIVKPLTELTRKDKVFEWTDECQKAFDTLKSAFVSPDIMAFPKDEGEYYLDTDACDHSIGAVLSQMQDGQLKVIAYGSRTLNKAECNYCITDKELLAARHFMEYYRQYLLGRKFCLRTDHQPIVWLMSIKEPKSRIARWLEILSSFNFSIEYRPGLKHGNSDALSRCPNPKDCECAEVDNMEPLRCGPCNKCKKRARDMQSTRVLVIPQDDTKTDHRDHVISAVKTRKQTSDENNLNNFGTTWNHGHKLEELREMQENDGDLGPIIKWKRKDSRPNSTEMEKYSAATRHYWMIWESLKIKNGLLYKQYCRRDGVDDYNQFMVPHKMKQEVLENMHNSLMSGHLGKNKTKGKIIQSFYWFEMREDITLWISNCDICAANKPPPKTPRAPLGEMPTGSVLDRLSTDLLGPLPITPRNNRYILTVTDYFTKWVEVFPVPDQTATTCAQVILNEVVCRIGFPLAIHSDQGRCYESNIFQELCQLLEIRKTRTSPRNPKCNGQVERFNRTLISMIKSYLKGEQTNWDLNLGCLAGAYRASPHETTGLTPNLLMLGREVRFPSCITKDGEEFILKDETCSPGEHALKIRERMHRAHEVARKHLEVKAKRRKDHYDVKANLNRYKKWDKVLMKNETRVEGVTPKFQILYTGPHLVLNRLNDLDYELVLDEKGTTKVINHNKLKPYTGSNVPKWMKKVESQQKQK